MTTYICVECSKKYKLKSRYESHVAKIHSLPKTKGTDTDTCTDAGEIYDLPRTTGAHRINITRPFLKWVGGKTQIITQLLELFPKKINNYHEPFLGGGSVLLALLSYQKSGIIEITGQVYVSDLNANLIGLYKNIQTHSDALVAEMVKLSTEFAECKGAAVNRHALTIEEARSSPESYYFWIRKRFNELPSVERTTIAASAMLLFLNKTCFRGLYREGPNGFNVPFGNYKNPSIFDADHIKEIATLITNVTFTHCAFTESICKIKSGDFVYLDPPYAPETDTSFTSYTSVGFNMDDHSSLFNQCAGMRERNIKMLMSNADVKLVKDMFPISSYTTKVISCRRAIHSKAPNVRANEVLIRNF